MKFRIHGAAFPKPAMQAAIACIAARTKPRFQHGRRAETIARQGVAPAPVFQISGTSHAVYRRDDISTPRRHIQHFDAKEIKWKKHKDAAVADKAMKHTAELPHFSQWGVVDSRAGW
ncbi:MAG TPA: hypothetical protein VEY91_12075 [Candidatus Limnocylindria bacterium]|nr:hypothetical protein [Candidatus Limnocylindria bacterium]